MPKTHCAAPELASLLDGSTAGELIPELARHGLQQLIELEDAAVIGADRHERTEERHGYRNGYRHRSLTTQVGDIDLLIPKLRAGSFLPSILEPRRRVDQALCAVIMEAYINGVSTRKVDALVAALGSQSGISKSQVSRICLEIDQQEQAFLCRPLQESGYAYVYMDATYLHGRLGKALQVCSRAVVVAMGVNVDGRRELLGLKVGDSESEGFWTEFIASLKERGLTGVKLVISDAHGGAHKGDPSPAAGLCLAASHRKVRLVNSPAFISPEIFCSVSQKPIRAWSPLPSAACSRRRTQPISSAAGMIWPSHWRNASPKLLS